MTDNDTSTDVASATRALTVRAITIADVERLAAHVHPAVARQRVPPVLLPHPRSRSRTALLLAHDVDHGRRDALVALDGDEIVAVARYDGRAGTDHRPRSP